VSYTVRVLCRPALAPGFLLAGLRPIEVETAGQAQTRLLALAADPGAGILLVEEELFDRLPVEFRRELARRPLPLLVPFPSPRWQTAEAEVDGYIAELLRQAIGYRVRLT
jgi:vacuolar-type H+-ATPase subunit F/Vma7